jgi:lysozyme
MALPKETLDLIKHFEGYLRPLNDGSDRVRPYLCPAKVWTVGFGSTFYEDRRKVKGDDPAITRERATRLLAFEIERICEPAVDKLVKRKVHPLSRGALVSFAFNCGTGALARSGLLRAVNEGRWHDIEREFAKWRMGGGRVLPGLVRRRKAESDMFLKGVRLLSAGDTGVEPSRPTPNVETTSMWRKLIAWLLSE